MRCAGLGSVAAIFSCFIAYFPISSTFHDYSWKFLTLSTSSPHLYAWFTYQAYLFVTIPYFCGTNTPIITNYLC